MSVTTTHPDYDERLREWRIMDDALVGESAIKSKGELYLPKPSGMVEAERANPDNAYLYGSYRARAQYEHWVRDNLRTSMGLATRLKPEVSVPKQMEPYLSTITDDGYSINQLYLRVIRQSLTHGRTPIIVDADNDGTPYIVTTRAEAAINWKLSDIDGRRDLALAVFGEAIPKQGEDEFSHETEIAYRVYRLIDGVCHTQLVSEAGEVIEEERPIGMSDTGGNILRGLPFLPIIYSGSTDNSPDTDEVPLLSMARAALKSYQLSADYFTSLHFTSHPQPWVSGLDDDTEISVTGPSAAWNLGFEGKCGYLEFQGHGINAVKEAMTAQRMAAAESGAKVLDTGAVESGESRKTRQSEQHASLDTIAITAAEAVEQALRYIAQWLGCKDSEIEEIRFTVNPDFSNPDIDPMVSRTLLDSVQQGVISADAYWQYITLGKLPERSYLEERDFIETQGLM